MHVRDLVPCRRQAGAGAGAALNTPAVLQQKLGARKRVAMLCMRTGLVTQWTRLRVQGTWREQERGDAEKEVPLPVRGRGRMGRPDVG